MFLYQHTWQNVLLKKDKIYFVLAFCSISLKNRLKIDICFSSRNDENMFNANDNVLNWQQGGFMNMDGQPESGKDFIQ